jgi:hypothetical protein
LSNPIVGEKMRLGDLAHRRLRPLDGNDTVAEAWLAQEWRPGAKRRARAVHRWGGRWQSVPTCSSRRGAGITSATSAGWSRGGARLDLGVKAAMERLLGGPVVACVDRVMKWAGLG